MCGFLGIITPRDEIRAKFDEAFEEIKPRGTHANVFKEGDASYGYARLPTDAVSDEQLSKVSRDKTKLLFNGLITNVEDLVSLFKLPSGASDSDAVCLRLGLEQYGVALLEKARGMFAFAQITPERVLLGRDGIGIKPLYYVHQTDMFAFASELKALRGLGAVHEVQPGTTLSYNRATGELQLVPFEYKSYLAHGEADLRHCLIQTIILPTRRYLAQSDKKVAILLSGGLDSSIIAGVLAAELKDAEKARINAYCVGSEGASDLVTANRLAQDLGFSLQTIRPFDASDAIAVLPQIVYDTESPHARVIKVALLYRKLADAIRADGIDIVIGGEGADELFHGYHRFIDGLTYEQSHGLFERFFKGVFSYTLLQRYDRIMARKQIEGRVPFLDQEVIHIARQIPASKKVHHHDEGHVSKLPLRQIAKELNLPSYIVDRPKVKMTTGATGQDNSSHKQGYLENDILALTGHTFGETTQLLYNILFSDNLQPSSYKETEEELMQQVKQFHKLNDYKGALRKS